MFEHIMLFSCTPPPVVIVYSLAKVAQTNEIAARKSALRCLRKLYLEEMSIIQWNLPIYVPIKHTIAMLTLN